MYKKLIVVKKLLSMTKVFQNLCQNTLKVLNLLRSKLNKEVKNLFLYYVQKHEYLYYTLRNLSSDMINLHVFKLNWFQSKFARRYTFLVFNIFNKT